jgi:2-polyprenyl-3-methyl-5-hydroxy-6-metoxy-1,4-benzoquinol methylase
MVQTNTPKFWEDFWKKPFSLDKLKFKVRKEERLIRWQRIESMVYQHFLGFEDLKVIEIGSGTGTTAALMAERGADVTVLDYSAEAIDQSSRLFDHLDLPVNFICADALDLNMGMKGQYDIAMSFGLAEHFTGEHRRRILKSHVDLLRVNGLALISVPNAANVPYRLYKWITMKTGAWSVAEEYPFSRKELSQIAHDLGLRHYGFFGDSLLRSKKFLNPIKWFPRKRKKKAVAEIDSNSQGNSSKKRSSRRLPFKEIGTPLDGYLSYALVLWAINSNQSKAIQ